MRGVLGGVRQILEFVHLSSQYRHFLTILGYLNKSMVRVLIGGDSQRVYWSSVVVKLKGIRGELKGYKSSNGGIERSCLGLPVSSGRQSVRQ